MSSGTSLPPSELHSIEPLLRAVIFLIEGITHDYNAVESPDWFVPKDAETNVDSTYFAEVLLHILSKTDPGNGVARTGDLDVLIMATDIISCLQRTLDDRAQTFAEAFQHGQKTTEVLTGCTKQVKNIEEGLFFDLLYIYMSEMLKETKR
jgi:hypothetical protein